MTAKQLIICQMLYFTDTCIYVHDMDYLEQEKMLKRFLFYVFFFF